MNVLSEPPASDTLPAKNGGVRTLGVLGTPLVATSYLDLWRLSLEWRRVPRCRAVDLTNTHIVTMRRHETPFATLTQVMDHFVPDSMPLVWCLNLQGAGMKDRVYGPEFMRRSLLETPAGETHYFLGASDFCLSRLLEQLKKRNPNLKIVGSRNGYFQEKDEGAIVDEINRLSPDFIWLGLGTPKQQVWIERNKSALRRGVIFAVGFAFDVNAGTKTDAPRWMQRVGLTWLYRMLSEPRRLIGRYVRYNSLFLFYLLADGIRGRAFARSLPGDDPKR